MSEIDLNVIRSMESHLIRISNQIIKLDADENKINKENFISICQFLTAEMGKNEIFKKIFKLSKLAGSYPDMIKISEPNEFDVLIILEFPNPHVEPSRPGYVTINIKDALGEDNYKRFVDDEGYLIQNQVLSWLRDLVRSTLLIYDNIIETEQNSYEIIQSSNGPAVTLNVTVQNSSDGEFSIDFVGALEIHSDVGWTADKKRIPGLWNAIPKPIKVSSMQNAENAVNVTDEISVPRAAGYKKSKKINVSEEADTLDAGTRFGKSENSNKKKKVDISSPRKWYRDSKKNKVSKEAGTLDAGTRFGRPENSNEKDKADVSTPRKWYRKRKNPTVNGKVKTPPPAICYRNPKKPIANGIAEIPSAGDKLRNKKKPSINEEAETVASGSLRRNLKKSRVNEKARTGDSNIKCKKQIKSTGNGKIPVSTVLAIIPNPNPNKNREWICSYAEIEREYFLKGTQNMKPLIRCFKKIRDNRKLTNLKSYYIKTIFLHHRIKHDVDYWKQPLAVLFMEMFDVILEHLREHQLYSFWHDKFNLFHHFRSEQITAVYDNLLKVKKDIEKNLLDGNPEFIYEVLCTEDERSDLEMNDSD